jgi:low temperature requirement protein LtrA
MAFMTEATPATRVTTLELFFDLVFVFTITQVTGRVVSAREPLDFLAAFLIFTVIWWMYGGYAWLTNNLNLQQTAPRLLLLAGMAGFLVMSLALPRLFLAGSSGEGVVFGLGYALVVLIHATLFTQAVHASSVSAIRSIAPYNFSAALLVLAAGFVVAPWNLGLYAVAVLIFIASSLKRRERGFVINATHFTERHSLVVLIVLGESLVAVGVGAEEAPLSPLLIGVATLGLALSAALWWSYFSGDDDRAEHVMGAMDAAKRSRAALIGYGYAHLVLIAGMVVIAAGVKQLIAHLEEPPVAALWQMGFGVALYLMGDAIFRQSLGINRGVTRWITGGLALLTIPLGLFVAGVWQLGTLVALLVGMLILENPRRQIV